MAKLYTKRGDGGETSLADGTRVSKSHALLEAIGTVDELNCHVGLARSHTSDADLSEVLRRIQCLLMETGAELASGRPRITIDDVSWIEQEIDRHTAECTPLVSFILPTGSVTASTLHICRTVCRRAERRVVAIAAPSSPLQQLLNRLSDLFFTLARAANHRVGTYDDKWTPQQDASH